MGRKKIEIEKIGCNIKRRMTFNKRSRGLLKKAKELAVLCDVDVALIVFSPAGKPQHFSSQPRIEHVIQRFIENTHEGNEAGICSGNKEEQCKGRYSESHLLESGDPSLSLQQIQSDPSGTNPSSGMRSTHWKIPMQYPHVWEAPQGREQVQMHRVPFVEMGDPSEVRGPYRGSDYMQCPPIRGCGTPFSSGVQSSSLWRLPEGETRKLEHVSNRPSQVLQQPDQTIIPNMPEEQIVNVQVSGTHPSFGVQSAHGHISVQHPQVVEPPHGREHVQIPRVQGVPFVEMGDTCSIKIERPNGASDYLQGPPLGGCEMPFFNSVQSSFSMSDLPGGAPGKLEHFSNQPRIEQFQQFNHNIVPNMAEEEMANLQVSEVSIQHVQEGDEVGMCSDNEEWASLLDSYMLESEVPSLSSSAHGDILMQQPEELEGPEGREQMQMQGVSLVEMEDPSSTRASVPGQFASSESIWPYGASDCMSRQPSPPGVGWDMPLYSDEDIELATLRRWCADE